MYIWLADKFYCGSYCTFGKVLFGLSLVYIIIILSPNLIELFKRIKNASPQKKQKSMQSSQRGFKPFGIAVCFTEKVILQYEEFEAIKLVNYNCISQEEAAESMEIPTNADKNLQ